MESYVFLISLSLRPVLQVFYADEVKRWRDLLLMLLQYLMLLHKTCDRNIVFICMHFVHIQVQGYNLLYADISNVILSIQLFMIAF